MKFNNRINDFCSSPYLFGVTSVEDIFWMALGYCIAEQKVSSKKSLKTLCDFIDFFYSEFNISNCNFNWGIVLRSYSRNNIHSIEQFADFFKKMESSEKVFGDTGYSKPFTDLIFNVPLVNIDEIMHFLRKKLILNNVIEVDNILLGYRLACIDMEIYDPVEKYYTDHRTSIGETILKEYKLPEYLNFVNVIYSKFYVNPLDGIDFFLKKSFVPAD